MAGRESCSSEIERHLHIGKDICIADSQAYLLAGRESCSVEMQRGLQIPYVKVHLQIGRLTYWQTESLEVQNGKGFAYR